MRSLYQRFRSAILAGLLATVPVGVTIWVVVLLIRFLESAINLVPDALQPQALLGFPIPGLGILLAISTLLFVGVATQNWMGRTLVGLYEAVLLKVPVLSSVYAAVKQLMEQLFTSKKGFEKVVLVEWPRKNCWSVAFVTGPALVEAESGEDMVSLFLPTTPNPTTGYYTMVPMSDIVQTDLTVEEGFKLLMSAGIVAPDRRLKLRVPVSVAEESLPALPTEESSTLTPVRAVDRSASAARLAEPESR